MATIALYANKINRMPGMIKDVKRTVGDYKTELSALKTRALTINSSACNLDDVISSIQTSTQTQEQKTASLDTFAQASEQFISDVVRIDCNVADVVKQRKDDFYDKYNYLKPECEKGGWEKFCNGLASVGDWCKEHWKIIVMAILAIAVIVVIVLFPAVAPLMLLIAKGALLCAAICGIAEGASSALTGGSFWEGFENGAFIGAIAAIILSGIAIVFTGVIVSVSLVLKQVFLSGAATGGGVTLIAELGGKFNNVTDISWGQMLQNMAFSAAFAEVFYNLFKAEGTADNVTEGTSGATEDDYDDTYDDYYDEGGKSERVGKQKGNAPRDNQKQNEQTDSISKELGLTKEQSRELHDEISGQGYGYQEILDLAKELLKK